MLARHYANNVSVSSQQRRDIEPMLVMSAQRLRRWPNITKHWLNVSCLLDSFCSDLVNTKIKTSIDMVQLNHKDISLMLFNRSVVLKFNKEYKKRYHIVSITYAKHYIRYKTDPRAAVMAGVSFVMSLLVRGRLVLIIMIISVMMTTGPRPVLSPVTLL